MTNPRDRRLARSLVGWFRAEARDLPWRRIDPMLGRRDPYWSLVSEVMLQQTQVSRVVERFGPFLRRFPSVDRLARAGEQAVLAEWSGMGYYRRAIALHRAAKEIVACHGGEVPGDASSLRALPGIGRYTAGAIASIVFGRAEPVVDGNVHRVLVRIEGRSARESEAARMKWAWARAAGLVLATDDPGALNEALMELGATVCTPVSPRCAECPVARLCIARREGLQDRIPAAARSPVRRRLFIAAVLVRDGRGRLLVERRGESGLWARMWQTPSIERADRPSRRSELLRELGLRDAETVSSFEHGTTHRLVRFEVWRGAIKGRASSLTRKGRVWADRGVLRRLPMSNPHRRIAREGAVGSIHG